MKKHFINAIGKKAFTSLLAFVIVFCSSVNLYASSDITGTNKAADVTYKGLKDKLLVFKVNYQNESAQDFELVIKNDQNEVFYTKSFDSRPLSTDVLLSEIPENCKLTFLIKSGKKELTKSFEINTEVKTTSQYVVKGL